MPGRAKAAGGAVELDGTHAFFHPPLTICQLLMGPPPGGGRTLMPMLSQLLGFSLMDSGGRAAKLGDLAAPLFEADYPPVTHLIFLGDDGRQSALPWSSVRRSDLRGQAGD